MGRRTRDTVQELDVPIRSKPTAGRSASRQATGGGVRHPSHRQVMRMPLAGEAEPQRRLAGVLPLCFMLILGTLLLAACADPPSQASEADQTPTTPQPVLRPRAAATEATTRAATPTTTATPDAPAFVQVAAGEDHSCALQQNGEVLCWGTNSQGQLNVPQSVRFRQITTGSQFSCGLRIDGGITCWGDNDHQQLAAPDGQFTAVDAGWDHACAVTRDGAQCWGWDANGRATPPGGTLFRDVGAGAEHSCGLTLASDLVCWGNNIDGRATSREGPFDVLAVGLNHTCVLRTNRTVLCQGDNTDGQSNAPDTPFIHLTAGLSHSCGVIPTGAIKCWGASTGPAINVTLAAPIGTFTSINAGWTSTCAVSQVGYVQCWEYVYETVSIPPYQKLRLARIHPAHSLSQPTDTFPWTSDGIAVVDRLGIIDVYTDNSPPKTMIDLRDIVDTEGGFFGLLSAAPDPNFTDSPFLYAYYTLRETRSAEANAWMRLARYPVVDGRAVLEEELVILDFSLPMPAYGHYGSGHYGGSIRFGLDGMLYLSIGDADCFECPQNLDNLYGKIIRIDVRGASADEPYRIPLDNPFLDDPNARPEIWAYGMRNPWRMTIDPETGSLWVGDVGHDSEEEVSIATAGANLGWPIYEGSRCLTIDESITIHYGIDTGYACTDLEDVTQPIVSYGHMSDKCAVVGGIVYRGSEIPWLNGAYLFGDYCSGQLWALDGDAEAGWRTIQIGDLPFPLSSLAADATGEVYVLTFGGPVLRLVDSAAGYGLPTRVFPSVTIMPPAFAGT